MNKELFEKYLNDQCTPEEAERVYEWLQTSEGEAYLKKYIDRDIRVNEEFQNYIEHPEVPSEKIFAKIQHDKNNHIRTLSSRKDNYRAWRWIGVAAATIMLLISAVFYLQQEQNQSEPQGSPSAAIVTTEDQDSTVSFSDGSRITLGPDSRLEVLGGYAREHRNVQLRGKAFFEVSEDTTLPFIVQTSHSYIRVLGTKFEVEAYPDRAEVKVKVDEGKVRFFSKDSRLDPIDLKSNESGILHLNTKEDSLNQEGNSAIATHQKPILIRQKTEEKNTKIRFANNRLFIAIDYLERNYDVDIELENDSLRDIRFTLVTDHSLLGAIEEIADSLNLTYEYNRQDNKLLLKKR